MNSPQMSWTPHRSAFQPIIDETLNLLKRYGALVDAGKWQGVTTAGHPEMTTKELLNVRLEVAMARPRAERWLEQIAEEIQPNLPWADDHFMERVAGEPTNPGEQYKNWPWWQGGHQALAALTDVPNAGFTGKFSHTYQERFWPRYAGGQHKSMDLAGQKFTEMEANYGIRYRYGDLNDVLNMLYSTPKTRQATFPIFFPEDTGAVHGGRVPCTLHYHFLMRDNKLHLWYPIRSCDAVRHFRDDLYMAARLCDWVLQNLKERELRDTNEQVWVDVDPGTLYFTAYSFHAHMGDYHHLAPIGS